MGVVVRGFDLYKLPKLALVMELLADNWVPNHLLTRGDTFTKDTPKFFFMSPKLGTPRAYYMALAHREKLYEVFGEALGIVHRMPESYYLSLLRLQDRGDAHNFLVNLEARGVSTIKDAEIKALGGIVDDDVAEPLPDLIPIGDFAAEDEENVMAAGASVVYDEESRRIALQVLVGENTVGPPAIKFDTFGYDYFSGIAPDDDDIIPITIHFDNCSHRSGRRRAWAKCGNKMHPACFRYVFVKNFKSMEALVVHLAAWTVYGMKPGMVKYGMEGHKSSIVPDELLEAGRDQHLIP